MAWTGLELARGAQEICAVRLAERGVFRNRSQHFWNKNCSFFLVAFIFSSLLNFKSSYLRNGTGAQFIAVFTAAESSVVGKG